MNLIVKNYLLRLAISNFYFRIALIIWGKHVFKTRVYKYKDNLILEGSDPDLSVKELDSLMYRTSKFFTAVDTLFLDASLMDSIHYGNGWMG